MQCEAHLIALETRHNFLQACLPKFPPLPKRKEGKNQIPSHSQNFYLTPVLRPPQRFIQKPNIPIKRPHLRQLLLAPIDLRMLHKRITQLLPGLPHPQRQQTKNHNLIAPFQNANVGDVDFVEVGDEFLAPGFHAAVARVDAAVGEVGRLVQFEVCAADCENGVDVAGFWRRGHVFLFGGEEARHERFGTGGFVGHGCGCGFGAEFQLGSYFGGRDWFLSFDEVGLLFLDWLVGGGWWFESRVASSSNSSGKSNSESFSQFRLSS